MKGLHDSYAKYLSTKGRVQRGRDGEEERVGIDRHVVVDVELRRDDEVAQIEGGSNTGVVAVGNNHLIRNIK